MKWNLFQLSRWCPAVKPWEWEDHPDYFHDGLDMMGIDDRTKENRQKRRS